MFGNLTISTRVVLVSAKGTLRHNHRNAEFVVTAKQTKFSKIAGRPAVKLLDLFKLAFILVAPARRVGWLGGRLKFNESARRRSLPHERDVRAPNAWISIFGHNDQPRSGREYRKQPFQQLLKSWGERRFRNVRVRSAKLPDSMGICLQEVSDAHCFC